MEDKDLAMLSFQYRTDDLEVRQGARASAAILSRSILTSALRVSTWWAAISCKTLMVLLNDMINQRYKITDSHRNKKNACPTLYTSLTLLLLMASDTLQSLQELLQYESEYLQDKSWKLDVRI